MAESRQRVILGKFDYENETPYGFALVLMHYIESSSLHADRASAVEEAIKRWTEAKMAKAQPELTKKLERAKSGLESIRNHITGILLLVDREEEAKDGR